MLQNDLKVQSAHSQHCHRRRRHRRQMFNCVHNEWDTQNNRPKKDSQSIEVKPILSRRPMLQFRLWSVCVWVWVCVNLKIKFLGRIVFLLWNSNKLQSIIIWTSAIHRNSLFGIRDDEISLLLFPVEVTLQVFGRFFSCWNYLMLFHVGSSSPSLSVIPFLFLCNSPTIYLSIYLLKRFICI